MLYTKVKIKAEIDLASISKQTKILMTFNVECDHLYPCSN